MYCHLVSKLFNCDLKDHTADGQFSLNDFLQDICKLVTDSYSDGNASNYASGTPCTDLFVSTIQSFITDENQTKTIKLWIQYLKMIEICLQFLKAERTGETPS